MMNNFTYKKSGLSVTFKDISKEVPVGSKYHWDFGDFGVSEDRNPTHVYIESGIYSVKLTITTPEILANDGRILIPQTKFDKILAVVVSDLVSTTLSDSIYNLIDYYIPVEILPILPEFNKTLFIEKWQLYLQPLVEHEILIEDYSDELKYEALENQLIMELSVYDYLMVELTKLIGKANKVIQDSSNTTTEGDTNQRVKQIVTGPSEVHFFEGLSGDIAVNLSKAILSAMQPGGVVNILKQNICMLAGRVNIYLPLCTAPRTRIAPKVVNRRENNFLSGPNPFEVLT